MRMKGKMEWWNGGRLRASSQHPNTPSLQHSNTPKLRSPPGFTLIELLAVVAIMSIILIAAIPMFQTMGKRDLGIVGSQLRATLRLARQYAVTQGQNVYVVFPDNRAGVSTNDLDKVLRSYSVLMTNATSGGFEYVTDWKYLPQGVYFDDTGNLGASIWNTAHMQPISVPFPASGSATRAMPGVNFRPNGRCYAFNGTTWFVSRYSIYFTTARFFNRNAGGTQLVPGPNPPGVTNNVRIRGRTGQVEIIQTVESY